MVTMKKVCNLEYYKSLLPKSITVLTERTAEGLYAKIKEFPHCHTQADNIPELIEMVNDAVFTYLEIPEQFVKEIGVVYLPEKLSAELRRQKIQGAFNELMKENMSSPYSSIYRRLDVPAQ